MKTIEFGKELITVEKLGNGDTALQYNEHIILLSSIVKFLKEPFNADKLTAKITIKKNGDNTISIGCLTDTNEKIKQIINTLT